MTRLQRRIARPRGRMALRRTLRTRSTHAKRTPPIPYIGQIFRKTFPAPIADYESLATASWSNRSVNVTVTTPSGPTGTPSFSGDSYEVYYYAVKLSDFSSGTHDVILPPVRFAMDEPSASGDNYDYWQDGGPFYLTSAANYLAADTFLPISGNAHVSANDPYSLSFDELVWCEGEFPGFAQIVYEQLGTGYDLGVYRGHYNVRCHPRYVRMRKNGTSWGPLIDYGSFFTACEGWIENRIGWQDVLIGNRHSNYPYSPYSSPSGNQLRPNLYSRNFRLVFDNAPGALYAEYDALNGWPGSIPSRIQSWSQAWSAGDTIEVDVWYQVKMQPCVSGRNSYPYAAVTDPHVAVLAFPKDVSTLTADLGSGTLVSKIRLEGLEVNQGFDPGADTYSVNFGTFGWHLGDGTSGAKKILIATTGYSGSISSYFANMSGTIQSGTYAGEPASVSLAWNHERVLLTLTGPDTAAAPPIGGAAWPQITTTYTPQDSDNYINTVTDNVHGTLNVSASGVFNKSGSTTFVPMLYPYSGVAPPTSGGHPASITVSRTTQ